MGSRAGNGGGRAPKATPGERRASGTVDFTIRVKAVLRAIPRGRVTSYGQVAALAGSPGASRQVVRILHACAGPEKLPWHRVLRKSGEIALPAGRGGEEQRALLEAEGVELGFDDRVDLDRFAWRPRRAIGPIPEVASKIASKVASEATSKVTSRASRKASPKVPQKDDPTLGMAVDGVGETGTCPWVDSLICKRVAS